MKGTRRIAKSARLDLVLMALKWLSGGSAVAALSARDTNISHSLGAVR